MPPTVATVPAVHSVLDANVLGAVVQSSFRLPEPFHCELLTRSVNDVYLVKSKGAHYAARLWRAGYHRDDEIAFEMSFLLFLRNQGVSILPPVEAPTGETFYAVMAPEGRRQFCLFPWVEGQEFARVPSTGVARRIGETLARMHLAGAKFQAPVARPIGYHLWIRDNLPALLPRIADRPEDIPFYRHAAAAIIAALNDVVPTLPGGPVHGDPHHGNVFVAADDTFKLLDFDNCGEANLLHDVACFLWATKFIARDPSLRGGLDDAINAAFLEGYTQVRPLEPREERVLPLFVAAKAVNMICFNSANVNLLGQRYLQFAGWDWFTNSIRRHLTEAGLM